MAYYDYVRRRATAGKLCLVKHIIHPKLFFILTGFVTGYICVEEKYFDRAQNAWFKGCISGVAQC